MLDFARTAQIDPAYLRHVVERLSAIGSSPLGFRATGTPEDRAVAEFVAGEMRDIGLAEVAIETVPVDGWRLLDARVEIAGGPRYQCASMGGAPPTGPAGVLAPLVDVGTGERARLDRLDVAGRIALLDWSDKGSPITEIGLELGLRGAVGIILNCPEGGPFYQSERALGSFASHWYAGAPPFVTMCKEDAAEIRAARPSQVRLTLDAELTPGSPGCNTVGYLPGARAGAPIVIGAHHDGWFSASFDNATGVAAMLGLARALTTAGHRPEHTLCFTSRTAEEYGLTDSAYCWCTGAWGQISETHPDWGAASPFHLNLEASGHPGLRLLIETPKELTRWVRRLARTADAEGWLTSGWYALGPPVTGTEAWPFLISGVPGISVYNWEKSFQRTDYHTQYDTPEIVDFAHLERQCRLSTLLLLSADADPDGILDHAARGRELAAIARKLGEPGAALAEAADAHRSVRGRTAFTAIGRGLCAVDGHGTTTYPHVQSARDAEHLEAAIAALARGDRGAAIRRLARVGENGHARTLSAEVFATARERARADHPRAAWGARSHPTLSPDLWHELASLRGEAGARERGPWIEESLTAHLEASRADLTRRLDAMRQALADSAEA